MNEQETRQIMRDVVLGFAPSLEKLPNELNDLLDSITRTNSYCYDSGYATGMCRGLRRGVYGGVAIVGAINIIAIAVACKQKHHKKKEEEP